MAMNSIITNYGAQVALQALNKTSDALAATQKRVSTGLRVADGRDDGAAFAVAERVRGDIAGATSANEQLGGVKGLLDVTSAALQNVSTSLQALRALAVKIGDGNITTDQRTQYQAQALEITNNIKSFINDAGYNSKNLLNATGTNANIIINGSGDNYTISAYNGITNIHTVVGTANAYTSTTAKAALTAGGAITTALSNTLTRLNSYGGAANYIDRQINFNKSKIDALEAGMAGLAMLDEAQGNADGALQWVAQALLLAPREAGLLVMQARLSDDAASCRALLSQGLGGVDAVKLAAQRLDLAELREAASAAPLEWRWQAALGLAQLTAEEVEAGIAALRLACIFSDDAPELQGLLGLQLAEQRRHAEAEPLLAAGIAASHGDAELRASYALTLLRLDRLAEARLAFEAAIADFGPHPSLICNLALTLSNQGLQEEALRISDDGGDTVASLGCRMGIQPYHPIEGSAAALHRTASRLGAALPHPPLLPHPPGFDPERRLRVGFFGARLGRHPVGWLTLSAIEALPEAEIEVACYSLKTMDDALGRRFHARADLWRNLSPGMDDAALAAAIRADAPDIVVDLGGHGEGGRVTALAYRAAPVQIKWVGAQSATTGVPAMDWMLTDAWETPPGSEAHYTEALLRMPDGYACYTPPPWAPGVGALPALQRGYITFGCFNNLSKITPEVLAAWGQILISLPKARLILRTHALRDAATASLLITRAAAAGIPVERLELHGPSTHDELLAAYHDIDIALDPFPYAGGLTACEALWMGAPLVAMAGSSFAGRHAVSHLNNIGLGNWVAEDVEGYVARAVAAAHELPALAELRAGMRTRMKTSPLMDAPRFAANLTAALRHAWRLRCAQTQSGAGSAR